MDKLFYAVTAPTDSSLDEFSHLLLTKIGPKIANQASDDAWVRVRIRDEAFSDQSNPRLSRVPYQGRELSLDAVIDLLIPREGAQLDGIHATLAETTSTFQGWRVEATAYANDVPDPDIGQSSEYRGSANFIQRVDGMSRDRFSIEWHIHGVHEIARAKENQRSMGRYIQNRIIEPVTPTAWLIDGYAEGARSDEAAALVVNAPITEPSFKDVTAGPGETEFFRMPVRMFMGREYRVA